jgi:penicillin-binding protein 2
MKYHFIRNIRSETKHFRWRMGAAVCFVLLLFIVLIGRMYYLQVMQHEKYKTLSDKNRVTVLPVAPNRGLIYDRHGVLLADNLPTFALHIVPEQAENLDATLALIDELIGLNERQLESFQRERKRRRRFQGVPLRLNISEDEAATIAVNSYRLPGVNVVGGLMRNYPEGEVFAHILGYVGRINEQELNQIDPARYRATQFIGKTGVERYYENYLHGELGLENVETDVRGRVLRILDVTESTAGNNLYLTIDVNLQRQAEKLMENTRGAIVAIDPHNGAILTLLSHPNFNPNLFVQGIDQDTYYDLTHDIDQPLFNRALRGQYPPASTIKPVVALQGLETGKITRNSSISDPGFFKLPNSTHLYRDWMSEGHGEAVNVRQAIIESCDTFFYWLGNKMGIRDISASLIAFGMGSPIGVDISGELGGLVPSPEWKRAVKNEPWYPGETVIASIGQGFMMATPMQLAHMAATLATRGKRVKPHVVAAIELTNGDMMEIEAIEMEPAFPDSRHWNTIHESMKAVIHSNRGTARYLSNNPYKIAGKTGTAQVFSVRQDEEYDASVIEERLRDHSLFIGYAPADNPKIAIAVIVENKNGASRIARQVFDAYLLGGDS